MIFSETFYVGYSSVNRQLELSNAAILKLFEDIASMHGSLAKDGLNDTESRWFLTGYHIKMTKRPAYDSRFLLKTWSHDMKSIQASREFEICDEKGNQLGIATSNWVRMNTQTMRPERVTQELMDAYGTENALSNFDSPWIEKLKEPENFDFVKEYKIDRNFIDANNHMNNVAYMELVNNVLPDEVYEKAESLEFTIMYKKAIQYSDTVKCCFTTTDDCYFVTIKNQDETDLHAVIKLSK